MPRKRETGGVRKRGRIWWLYYRVDGKRYDESTGQGDERVARSMLAQRRREIRDRVWTPPGTVREYLEDWLAQRRRNGVRGIRDEERYFRVHVIPVIGSMKLHEVTATDIKTVMDRVRSYTSELTGKPLAPRSVLHVYRTTATAFNDAVFDGRIDSSPCKLRERRGELPKKRDRDFGWRSQAVYSRDEAVTLMADERVPFDRRIYYGLMLLGGLRASEAAGRRWRDYDPEAKPLGRLVVSSQADGATGDRPTKTGEVRQVPVHPALAALLAEWRLHGFALVFGRHPTPEDPIVPNRVDGRSFRKAKQTLVRLRDDRRRIGMRQVPAGQHAMRSTFLSLLEVDGANIAIVRRATHAAPSDIVGGYIRVQWTDVCRELAKLKIDLRRGEVIPMRRAVGDGDKNGDSPSWGGLNSRKTRAVAVRGTGLEPAHPKDTGT